MTEVEDRQPVQLIADGSRWRMLFAAGFLDGDAGRPRAAIRLTYWLGWKIGRFYAGLRRPV